MSIKRKPRKIRGVERKLRRFLNSPPEFLEYEGMPRATNDGKTLPFLVLPAGLKFERVD